MKDGKYNSLTLSDGLETKKIKTSYSGAAGTALIIMEDVKVPIENLLGKENQGFPVIMYNFNHERWYIVCGIVRMARLVVEECLKWTNQRMVFGQKLIEQPVIRQKCIFYYLMTSGSHYFSSRSRPKLA